MLTREELGARIAAARTDAAVSQSALGELLGVDASAISRMENGSRRVDSLELSAIADATGRPAWWFMEDRASTADVFLRAGEAADQSRRDSLRIFESLVSDMLWLRKITE